MLVGSADLQESLGNSRKQGFGIGRLHLKVLEQGCAQWVRTVETPCVSYALAQALPGAVHTQPEGIEGSKDCGTAFHKVLTHF